MCSRAIQLSELIVNSETELGRSLVAVVNDKKMVFFCGMAGTGKSLLVQQVSLLAHLSGRPVYLLQWDTVREPFETPDMLSRFPEVGGVTHPGIRLAVGQWARAAIHKWHQEHSEDSSILIGEVPAIGNRLSEILLPRFDSAEALLASSACSFVLPVPTKRLRSHMVSARRSTIENPSDEREKRDAPPEVVAAHWTELQRVGREFGLSELPKDENYEPQYYKCVFARLLGNRPAKELFLSERLEVRKSVYSKSIPLHELRASAEAVSEAFRRVLELHSEQTMSESVSEWFR